MTQETIAIERITTFKPDTLLFSGGKDSAVCWRLLQKTGLSFRAVMNLTTVDAKPHLDFVRQYFPGVELIRPEVSMYELIKKYGLPTRKYRFCCEHLKERYTPGSFVVTGVRQKESQQRKDRPMVHQHPKRRDVKVLNPIIDWSTADVWRYTYAEKLPISPLYLPPYNFRRVGCIGCPMANKSLGRQFRFFPEYKRLFITALRGRVQAGKYAKYGLQTAEAVFDWWLSQVSVDRYTRQQRFCLD